MPDLVTPKPTQLEDYQWLIGPDAAPWLQDAVAAQSRLGALGRRQIASDWQVQLTQRLRKELSPARTALILEQANLRRRAKEKFASAGQMFFTAKGLQQATDQAIAQYKAGRFPNGELVDDLCCGIGGDLLGLAQRGPVRAIDRDPTTTILAGANCPTAEVVNADVSQAGLADVAAWHIDPDRRPDGRRSTRVEFHQPSPDVLARLLKESPHAAIKLAPATHLSEPWWRDAEWEWISRGGECRQLVAWFGNLAQHPGRRRATLLSGEIGTPPVVAASIVGEPGVDCPIAPQIGRYVYEPDAALLAAKLDGHLAAELQLAAVAAGIAYYTGDLPVDHPAMDGFEVLDVMPFQPKRLKRWLAERRIGRLEVKKRGVQLDPNVLERRFSTGSDEPATMLLARIAGRVAAILARRLPSAK